MANRFERSANPFLLLKVPSSRSLRNAACHEFSETVHFAARLEFRHSCVKYDGERKRLIEEQT